MDSTVTCSKIKFIPWATTILATLPISPFKMRYEKQSKNVKFRAVLEGEEWFYDKT